MLTADASQQKALSTTVWLTYGNYITEGGGVCNWEGKCVNSYILIYIYIYKYTWGGTHSLMDDITAKAI
jgi:hypothetical protein